MTTITERPILFAGPMVRAILDGRKTQTRRPIRNTWQLAMELLKGRQRELEDLGGQLQQAQLKEMESSFTNATDAALRAQIADVRLEKQELYNTRLNELNTILEAARDGERFDLCRTKVLEKLGAKVPEKDRCPYGHPGDRLWVRESWQQFFEDEMPAERPRGPIGTMGCPATPDRTSRVFYRADGEPKPHDEYGQATWVPSIYMPRWASRLTLEITDVRVQRVQEISEPEAIAEGLRGVTKDGTLVKYGIPDRDGWPGTDDYGWPWDEWRVNPIEAFARLWDSINAKRGVGWDANPWVWAVSFKVTS